MQPLKWILGVAILGAWFAWDFSAVCVRTFILGQSAEEQIRRIEEDDEE
jgi:hypothetical protein